MTTRKTYREGTHRTQTPVETLARIAPLLAPMGITRVATITGLDVIGIPVVIAVRPAARTLATAQGKGLHLAAAQVSACMESAETYAAERIRHALVYGSVADLATLPLLPVTGLPPLPGQALPGPEDPLLWIEGTDLLHERRVWLPYDCVHTRYTAIRPGPSWFDGNTTGLASGNHVAEAAVHALAEVIERDAAAGPWERVGAEWQLDLDTVDDPGCRGLLDACAAAGVQVAVWERPSAIGMPVYLALMIDREDDPWRRLPAAHGSGGHPDRGVALARALTEAAQARLTLIAGVREDLGWDEYAALREPVGQGQARAATAKNGARPFGAAPSVEHDTCEADLRWLLTQCATAGIPSVVAVELTLDPRIPVVRVVVPGLSMALPGAQVADRGQAA